MTPMAAPDCNALLAQLQAEVSLVLAQAGRVFGAIDATTKKAPVAQVNKLKQILPKASSSFHQALDGIEAELRTAQLVFRRDLALLREQAGHRTDAPDTVQITHQLPENARSEPRTDEKMVATDREHIDNQPVATDDVTMEDAQPEQPSADQLQLIKDTLEAAAGSPDAKRVPVTDSQAEEGTQSAGGSVEDTKDQTKQLDEKPTENALQLDTAANDSKADKPPEDEKAPDTAKESINNDLDSLFGGGDTNTNTETNNEFTFDENATGDIDFGDFTNFNADNGDNDNISSLLPGLEDYANTQSNASGAELDLNSFFNTNPTDQNNNAMNQQGAGEQRDTTFDDLMDLANFDGSAMGDEANNTGDIDFESLFN